MSTVYRVTLYIPSDHEKAAHYIEQACAGFSSLTGGATAMPASGTWVMQDGAFCIEPMTQVSTLGTQADLARVRAFAHALALEIKAVMAQEAVLITVDKGIDMELV